MKKTIRLKDKVFASTGAERKDDNVTVGVTAHCKCGHVFTDDIVACKPIIPQSNCCNTNTFERKAGVYYCCKCKKKCFMHSSGRKNG